MANLALAVNGRRVEAETEPRTHLADFLRGQQLLMGTHIGCEHGVCGACTVLIDGAPARSCITFAVACAGAEVTTIEGLGDDEVTNMLRKAFSTHHALQCGYCTPAMLVSARDIITRLPDADEKRIRLELSGNLCRCTGYVGIVAAIKDVLQQRRAMQPAPFKPRASLGPAGAHPIAISQARSSAAPARTARGLPAPTVTRETLTADHWKAVESEGVELTQSFHVAHPREEVWTFFNNLKAVAQCMPGARLTSQPADNKAEGEVSIKLGPIVSAFSGSLEVDRDDANYRGTVRAAGRDSKSASNARALIGYKVAEANEGSQVDVSVKFMLTGPLAQFGRSGLVKDVADHLTRVFARNLEAALSGAPQPQETSATLDAAALARAAVWARVSGFFRRLFGW